MLFTWNTQLQQPVYSSRIFNKFLLCPPVFCGCRFASMVKLLFLLIGFWDIVTYHLQCFIEFASAPDVIVQMVCDLFTMTSKQTVLQPVCVVVWYTRIRLLNKRLTDCNLFFYIFYIRFSYLRCCGCPWNRGRQHLATPLKTCHNTEAGFLTGWLLCLSPNSEVTASDQSIKHDNF